MTDKTFKNFCTVYACGVVLSKGIKIFIFKKE